MIAKCIYKKRYCRGFVVDWIDSPGVCDIEEGLKSCRNCEKSAEHSVTVCKEFSFIQIEPKCVTIDDITIPTADIIELWVDYGDEGKMIPEIIHK